MPIGTRGVFAIVAALLMTAGVVASVRDRGVIASKLMAAAFAVATLWAVLGLVWSSSHDTMLGTNNYIALASMAATATIYYGYKAVNGVAFSDRL